MKQIMCVWELHSEANNFTYISYEVILVDFNGMSICLDIFYA